MIKVSKSQHRFQQFFYIIVCIDYCTAQSSHFLRIFSSLKTHFGSQLSLASPKGRKATLLFLVAKEHISVFQLMFVPSSPTLFFCCCCSRDKIPTNILYINTSSTLVCSRLKKKPKPCARSLCQKQYYLMQDSKVGTTSGYGYYFSFKSFHWACLPWKMTLKEFPFDKTLDISLLSVFQLALQFQVFVCLNEECSYPVSQLSRICPWLQEQQKYVYSCTVYSPKWSCV